MPQVSIRDVAERAGVALGTVSNVLNRPEKVAPATRERVLAAIDQLGFVRNDAARQLKAGRSNSIGFILLDVRNPFFTDVARGAEQQATQHGLSVLLANSDDSPERESSYLDLFVQQRVQGLLVSPLGNIADRLERLKERGIITVLVDRRSEGRQFSSVSVDDVAGGFLAVSHLIEQGCKHIAYVGGPLSIKQVADRLHGANQACATHPEVQLEVLLHDGLGVHQGREAGRTILSRSPANRPDAAFCANDLLAMGVLQSLTMLARLRVPEDLRLVGYDDIDFASATVVPLTSVRQPSLLIGKTAVELLVEQIGPDPINGFGGAEPREVVFQPELIVRESTVGSAAVAAAQAAGS
ncbi:MAG TPA: LacI family DNA-binding transcriptional regulator [Microlunatus sp.]|nr:LacI family DNA-binding transcriptional regulator [Microlunatus sp.]